MIHRAADILAIKDQVTAIIKELEETAQAALTAKLFQNQIQRSQERFQVKQGT